MVLSKLRTTALRHLVTPRMFSTRYKQTLEKHPILMQAVQAGFLMGAGDFIAQIAIEQQKLKQWDYIRTLRFFSIGFVIAGPGLRKWYGVLDKYVKAKTPIGRTMQKMCIDQFIFAPIFLCGLLSAISYMQHQDIDRVKSKIQSDYFDILLANYSVWPVVQIINFQFVPLNYQVLLTQTVAVFWNIYFSWKANSKEKQQPLDGLESTNPSTSASKTVNAL